MFKSIIVVGVLTLVTGLSTIAEAKGKKATVCFAFTEVKINLDGVSTQVAVCGDGKSPKVLTEYKIMSVPTAEGGEARAAVGF